MQSRASAPTMKTMGVRIFQLWMAQQVGEKLHACSAFSTGCRHVKKDPWYSDTGRKQADTLNMGMSLRTRPSVVICRSGKAVKYIEILDDFSIVFHEFLCYSLDRRAILSTDLLVGKSLS